MVCDDETVVCNGRDNGMEGKADLGRREDRLDGDKDREGKTG